MQWNNFLNNLQNQLGTTLPGVLGALLILAIGWIIAVVVRAGLRRGLGAAHLNERVSVSGGKSLDLEKWIAMAAFWLVILVTLMAVFNALNLEVASGPFAAMVGQIMAYLPQLVAGVVLALIAWLVASVLRALTQKLLASTTMDERLSAHAGMEPMSGNLANVVFWLVLLLFLPMILGALELHGLLGPVQGMLDRVLQMLPNILAAVVIGFVGWLVATVLRALVSNLLAAMGLDSFAQRAGMNARLQLSRVAGTVVFILVFVPSLIAALEALQIESISLPATAMLAQFLNAVPNIIAAAIILVVTWYVAKFVATLVSSLLAGMGVDQLPRRMGLTYGEASEWRLSQLVGGLILYFAMLFAVAEAANRLEFSQVRDIVSMLVLFSADVLLGTLILAIGFWLARLAGEAIMRTGGERNRLLASVARVAIVGLVLAMGLRAMGIANEIVNLAFGLTLGAVAVAVALSFGLGGREAAGRQMEHWLSRLRRKDEPPPPSNLP